ncbi:MULTISPECIES: hypothetical protein [Bacillus]|nr:MULTISPECIES: hypothetical protein [Bacillus]MDQ9094256.1 hypothetical protein [Bacillus licheniformis]MDU0071690.1 hypothetical protein [Bacillus sp. IG6]MEC0490099.1 hypothetical protein [Bacillus licheniformis]MED8021329.1 hypothetical protein [Bacillus glycinifermentans]
MTKTKKYVRILKAKKPSHWYADKIGEVFEVEREANLYTVRRGDESLTAIRKEDAELIITEKRPAKVGEKVLILDDFNEPKYMLHDVVPVIGGGDEHGVAVRKLGEWPIYLNNEQYEVIVNNEEDDEVENVEQRYDIAVETARDAIEELRLAAYAKGYEDARRELMAQAPVEKTAQERRDEIVEQAKADVERLRMINRMLQTFDITFDINRESRTVEAVAKKPNSRTAFYGTAICAPDDCFNIHIGEAIALHRALGLEVPDEYLNAPQPTEVRVGDVVECGSLKDVRHVKVVADGEYIGTGLDKAAISSITVKHRLIRIIDDSRTEVGE